MRPRFGGSELRYVTTGRATATGGQQGDACYVTGLAHKSLREPDTIQRRFADTYGIQNLFNIWPHPADTIARIVWR